MTKHFLDTIPISYALRSTLKRGYSLATAIHDLRAALVVSLVALPLAMALSIAVGLPPQYGIYTAIVAGIIVPLLGGSVSQVSGPTAAFVVIVAPIVAEHGLRGVIITEVLAGILLILLGIGRFGRYIHYIPYPVIMGFTSGIAVVIGTLALNDFLGLGIVRLQGEYIHKLMLIVTHLPDFSWPEALVGVISLVVMFVFRSVLPAVPSPVLGVVCGTVIALLLQQYGFEVVTIGSRFSYDLPGGEVGHGIPPFLPHLHLFDSAVVGLFAFPDYEELRVLMVPALIVAALAAIESLLSAAVADGIAGTRHNPNAELLGIGVGNILSGLAAGVPATGAIARTSTNIQSGAKTPIASCLHAVFILLYVLFLTPFLSYIPMASLAALLLFVAYRMSHYQQFVRTIQLAPRSDTIVLLVCFSLTVFIDMVAGVMAGVVLACFLFIQRISHLMQAEISHPGVKGTRLRAQRIHLPEGMIVYHLNGILFFGTVNKALERTDFLFEDVHTVIMDLEQVPLIDMTGLVAMKMIILDILGKQRKVIICGPHSVTEKIMRKLPPEVQDQVKVVKTVRQAVKG